MLTMDQIQDIRRLQAEAAQGEIYTVTKFGGEDTPKIEGAIFIYDEGGHEVADARLICALWNNSNMLLDAAEFALRHGFVLEADVITGQGAVEGQSRPALGNNGPE